MVSVNRWGLSFQEYTGIRFELAHCHVAMYRTHKAVSDVERLKGKMSDSRVLSPLRAIQ